MDARCFKSITHVGMVVKDNQWALRVINDALLGLWCSHPLRKNKTPNECLLNFKSLLGLIQLMVVKGNQRLLRATNDVASNL